MANELVDSRIKSHIPGIMFKGIMFKADFEKAFDHVNRGFISWVLKEMGFSKQWIGWIERCISSVPLLVLTNGEANGLFRGERH